MCDKIITEFLPNALMIGVDYDLFWVLNPKSLSPFIKAFRLKQEYDDVVSWRNGMYIKLAITSSFNKNSKYPEHPLLSKPKIKEESQEVIMDRFLRHMNLINSKFRKEE